MICEHIKNLWWNSWPILSGHKSGHKIGQGPWNFNTWVPSHILKFQPSCTWWNLRRDMRSHPKKWHLIIPDAAPRWDSLYTISIISATNNNLTFNWELSVRLHLTLAWDSARFCILLIMIIQWTQSPKFNSKFIVLLRILSFHWKCSYYPVFHQHIKSLIEQLRLSQL